MGADAFVAYYGVRYLINPDDTGQIDRLESNDDPRLRAAESAGLETYWGRLTDGGYYFLLVGTELGSFGVEGELYKALKLTDLTKLADGTKRKLASAGIEDEPALHFQLEAQY